MKFVLASNSPRRKEILTQINLKFDIIPSEFEETENEMDPEDLVKYFAYMKAKDVLDRYKAGQCPVLASCTDDTYIIGSDTIVYCDKVMGKPKNDEDAYQMLSLLSGREHYVMSGVSVININSGEYKTDFAKTKVFFRELSDQEINKYISTKEPLDKAGAYAIQGIGSLFVEKIEGCYFNVVGFPINKFSKIMEQFNYNLL